MLLLAGTLTDLLVVPWFRQRLDGEAPVGIGCIADDLAGNPTRAPMRESSRNPTAVCCCSRWSRSADLEWYRSRQTTDLCDGDTKVAQNLLVGE